MREIISQAHAARIRNVSRQRISDLVKQGRFTTPQTETGTLIEGAIYLDEIINFETEKRGRPRKSQPEWFKTGDTVLWSLKPRGAFGFVIPIVATVIKIADKKIQLRFIGGDNSEHFAWASRDDCILYDIGASDNEVNAEDAPRLEVLDELTNQAQELKMGY